MSAQKIAVINQKGGVGKTTTAINAGAYLAKSGYTVLVVDFDPQGNATSGLGFDKQNEAVTSYDILMNAASLSQAIKVSSIDNLNIVPANASLASAEVELVNMPSRELRLREAITPAHYDFILIDCPPALGLLTINALAAADSVLIPVQAEYYALEGLGQLLSVIQRARETLNPNLDLLGVVLTMYDKRTSLAEQVLAEVHKHFGDKLFTSIIPRNVRLAEAPSYGQAIVDHDRWSKGARAYKQLAKEIEKRARS